MSIFVGLGVAISFFFSLKYFVIGDIANGFETILIGAILGLIVSLLFIVSQSALLFFGAIIDLIAKKISQSIRRKKMRKAAGKNYVSINEFLGLPIEIRESITRNFGKKYFADPTGYYELFDFWVFIFYRDGKVFAVIPRDTQYDKDGHFPKYDFLNK